MSADINNAWVDRIAVICSAIYYTEWRPQTSLKGYISLKIFKLYYKNNTYTVSWDLPIMYAT